MESVSIIIGGDLVPTESNYSLFNMCDIKTLIGDEILNILDRSDYRIFNLEVPICDKEQPIHKCGPNLIAPTSTIAGIKAINPTVLTLANNHIMDQGIQGYLSTVQVLKENNIDYVGVGDSLKDAAKAFVLKHNSISIGIYACAEHEFSIANEHTKGANPFNPLDSLDHIQKLKEECDYVIVLYHGGKEHYRYPSPYLQKICKKIVEKGADLVVCQHSHCIGCFEEYEGSTIIYGQGNFLFDYSESEFWKTSLLLNVIIKDSLKVEYIPIVKIGNAVRISSDKQSAEILKEFIQRSSDIKKEGFIKDKYSDLAKSNRLNCLYSLSGFGRIIRKIDRIIFRGLLINKVYCKRKRLAIQNYIQCEAHRELLLNALTIETDKKNT